jgi:mono/diheme cytochrome c family protein
LLFWLVAALALVVVSGLFIMRHGFSARIPTSSFEVGLARAMRHYAVPSAARSQNNPFHETPELITEARRHFADHCANCHANDGTGSTQMGQNLFPRAPDMRLRATQDLSDGELYYIIHNGVPLTGMPAWGAEENDLDSWKLVLFIRHLPVITPQEVADMAKYNPKTETDRIEEREEEDFLSGKPLNPQKPSNK